MTRGSVTEGEIREWGHRLEQQARERAAEAGGDDAGVSEPPAASSGKAPFRPRPRASLPRFDRTLVEDARLLAAHEPVSTDEGQMLLRLDDEDVVDSCPAWLIEMYRRADAVQRIRGPMPMSFSILLGALVSVRIEDRTGREVVDRHCLDEVIGWCHPRGWRQRVRDWANLDRAFEELPSYRITIGDYRFWTVIGEGLPARYERGAAVLLRKRVPASAARGIRISWPQLVAYRPSALLTRAYLSVHAVLDRSAHHGHPLTREIYAPILGADGQPLRAHDGRIVRSGERVPNPLIGKAAVVRAGDVARFLGMSNTKSARQDARRAFERLAADRVVDMVQDPGGYRFFGVLPKRARAIDIGH